MFFRHLALSSEEKEGLTLVQFSDENCEIVAPTNTISAEWCNADAPPTNADDFQPVVHRDRGPVGDRNPIGFAINPFL